MLLTISTTRRPAEDLGYLLHKHPGRVHEFVLPYGVAHVLYPEASEDRCTAALLLEVAPLHIARRGFGVADAAPLGAYVNDRPYVASSYLSVALAKVFGSALLHRRRRSGEAPYARWRLACRTSRARLHHGALPEAPALAG